MTDKIFRQHLQGDSALLQQVLHAGQMVAGTDVTVLITGESGTGKERLAQAIHQASKRTHKPFIALNCAAIPENLVEAELFGYRKGAFTGALRDHPGYIERAHEGVLFLDEVGELPLATQAKLLRFLEMRTVTRLSDVQQRPVDVRIIAATNQNLSARMQQGHFRQDLFYRLHVVPLELPPLRERHGDVQVLLTHFRQFFAKHYDLPPPRYSKSCQQQLESWEWPGNVRELRNFCERMQILFSNREVQPQDLPDTMQSKISASPADFILPASGINFQALEASLLEQALANAAGNRSQAARLLGLSRDTFLYRLQKYFKA
ncbi:sigma-54 interaction domain-containing protein [Candidatus Venteria ishoeyi]|uniref:Acetoin dehydrogenase operon transcriptional activator AcoR n=1 Tax=Candidatus Venteria ishoeyi TaxID=1899563 RepID=A0A1H6FEN9_9GAMM|nr:sigma-54 dependent transcriptional regulator [Candidatus Venteria ishoeyi]SEH07474.1 Acetoin dehydrogenase operon transcriptional activator AcoR [Candidatus Venteria ishoeyi]